MRYTWIFGLAVCVVAALLWTFIPYRRRLQRFTNREDLSFDDIYSQFFRKSDLPKDQVMELWNEVAKALSLPPGKLRPTDRFAKELAPVEGWEFDDDIVEVYWAADRRLKKMGLKVDHSNVHTLGDYVEFFCKLHTQQPYA